MPSRILFSVKIVKGERRMKYRNLFQIFFMPNRILSSSKIVKGESRGKWKTKFSTFDYAEPDPVFSENSHFRESHTRSRLKKREGNNRPADTVLFRVFFRTFQNAHILLQIKQLSNFYLLENRIFSFFRLPMRHFFSQEPLF